jgi:hypothetical protein
MNILNIIHGMKGLVKVKIYLAHLQWSMADELRVCLDELESITSWTKN